MKSFYIWKQATYFIVIFCYRNGDCNFLASLCRYNWLLIWSIVCISFFSLFVYVLFKSNHEYCYFVFPQIFQASSPFSSRKRTSTDSTSASGEFYFYIILFFWLVGGLSFFLFFLFRGKAHHKTYLSLSCSCFCLLYYKAYMCHLARFLNIVND